MCRATFVALDRAVKMETEPAAAPGPALVPPPPPPDVQTPPPEAALPSGVKRKREDADYEALEALLSARSECAYKALNPSQALNPSNL